MTPSAILESALYVDDLDSRRGVLSRRARARADHPASKAATSSSAAARACCCCSMPMRPRCRRRPTRGCRCRRMARAARVICALPQAPRRSTAGRRDLAGARRRDRSRFRMAEWRPLDLFPRSVRQFARIRRTAHLGTLMHKLDAGRIVVASHNDGKLREIADLIAPFGLEARSAAEYGLPEPDETGTTFEENAYIKAHAAAVATGLPALSDDSGMCADALGRPARRLYRELGGDRRTASATSGSPCRRSRICCARRARSSRRTARRGSSPSSAWPGPTAMPNIIAARSRARLSGRRAASSASATIRCSCPTATTRRSAR